MPKPSDDRAENIYRQILDLLEELWLASSDTGEAVEEEEEAAGSAPDHDFVDEMVEDATSRGIDEESAEKVFKAVSALAKKAQEG